MITNANTGKTKYHIMMAFLVILWGLEYAVAKEALDFVDTLLVMSVKYFIGLIVIAVIVNKMSSLKLPERSDIPVLIITTILGHIVYFFCEYTALATVPVANITIIFGFLPIGSIIIEKILFRRRTSVKLYLFMAACVFGIFLVIGSDYESMRGGSASGYLMCLGALGAWLAYMFLTEGVAEKYGGVRIAFYQSVIAFIMTSPIMFSHLPELSALPPKIMVELLYLGIISEGLCFLIEITGLEKLGPTISAVYSNFLPVTTALFGVILLGQDLVPLQYLGGVIVIVSGLFVIREKDRLTRRG